MTQTATAGRPGLLMPRDKEKLDFGRLISAADYGFRFDGLRDNGPDLQRALADGSVIITPPAGALSSALINSTVTIPAGRALVMPSFGDMDNSLPDIGKLVTTAPINTFVTAGSRAVMIGVGLRHDGTSGSILRAPVGSDHVVEACLFNATSAANTDPLVYVAGSSFTMDRRTRLRNARTNAYAIEIDRTTAGNINVESHYNLLEITGVGRGIWIHTTASGGVRPEGVHLLNSSILCKGQQLLINDVLSFTASTCTFDQYQGTDGAIVIDPLAVGCECVEFISCWLASQGLNGVRGPALRTGSTNSGAGIKSLGVTSCKIGFAQDGIALGSSVASAVIAINKFRAISGYCVRANQSVRTTIVGNMMEDYSGGPLYLRDGSNGGPFIVNENHFGEGAHDIVKTTGSKFLFGTLNSGTPLP